MWLGTCFKKRIGNEISSSDRGAVTLEASIAMPAFICVVLLISFLLRAIYVQEYVQHSITQAANEIAGVSYLYGISGALDVQRDLEDAAGGSTDRAVDTVMKFLELEDGKIDKFSEDISEFKELISSFVKGKVNGYVFGLYARFITGKYLSDVGFGNSTDTDLRLKDLNVKDGYYGLDFQESGYMVDGSEDIRVHVKYDLKLPLSIPGFSEIAISQSAYTRAWLAGSDGFKRKDMSEEVKNEDIWSLSNFERGARIQEIFHANLPSNFPGISSYENGVVTKIRSLDTTAKSYSNASALKREIQRDIDNLVSYGGQVEPWGREKTVIMPDKISVRRYVLVIPTNDIDVKLSDAIDACIQYAMENGIYMQVERYGEKVGAPD